MHRKIKQCYGEDIRREFQNIVRQVLSLLKIYRCIIAFDITKDLYWGRHASLNVRQIEHERGADEAFEWLVVSMVKPVPLMLMALPYRQGDDLASLAIQLFEYVKSLKVKVDVALFDRGFYNAHLIDYLEGKRKKYLILVPENEKMKFYAALTEKISVFNHTMYYTKDKSSWKPTTHIVVIKDVHKGKKKFDVFFATSLAASMGLLRLYPKRWQIETNFRVMDEAKIKSKSNVHIVRYFYFLVQLLLHLAWNVTKKIVTPTPFKSYLAELSKQLLVLFDEGIT